MIEPEMAFCDLEQLMDIEEEMLKFVVKYVVDECPEEMEFFDKFVEKGIKAKLQNVIDAKFTRISHHDVVDLLLKADVKWEFKPSYEDDIAKEHEKYICDLFKAPVFIKDWPKDIKAYYMKLNPDGKTVASTDLLVPGIGEMIGASQREDNFELLNQRIKELNMTEEDYYWYMDLRKYGTVPHSGFGIGFERLIMYTTGMENIRDVSAFPRTKCKKLKL